MSTATTTSNDTGQHTKSRATTGSKSFTYLNLDGWRYWTMSSPVEKTILINRARLPEPS